MKQALILALALLPLAVFGAANDESWITLFDGKSLEGWKANENPQTFKLEEGKLIVHGPRSHLFYVGPVQNHDFKNFELKLEIMTFPSANSGVYFHTEWQDVGFPRKGHEVQVNNSHKDPKRTAGLYGVKDNYGEVAKDSEWFTMHIIVQNKHVITKINDKLVIDYTEPEAREGEKRNTPRRISSGTFALQGHDPGSQIHYRNIRVKPLPEK